MKNWIKKYLSIIIKKLEALKKKLENDEKMQESLNFHSLTPVVLENDESFSYYEKSLKWALKQKDCRNIAISGIYGSGKSSIINTFLEKNQIEHINISLANFNSNTNSTIEGNSDTTKEGNSNSTKNDELNSIEKSIIHQILYTVNESKIPNSRLKRIKHTNDSKLKLEFFKICLFSFLVYLFWNLQIVCYTPLSFLHDKYYNSTHIILLCLLGFFIWTYYKKHSNTLQNIGIQKLNFKNGEIEIKDKSTNSVLNQYVDELIYFFTQNPVELVVFEDLDRFNNLKIFSDLRQLNLLINSNETIKKNGKVVFLYAVKDDLFTDEQKNERVKFFDFILPVISVINSSNSYAKLKEILGEDELKELSDQFLQDICLYINDLRLLKNICNEYQIFKHLIKEKTEIKYDLNKIFAMAIYKNYFPKDYNELILDKGNLHYIFSSNFKNSLIENIESDKETDISEKNNEKNNLQKAISLGIKDIQMMYLYPLLKRLRTEGIRFVNLNQDEDFIDIENIDYEHLEILFKSKISVRKRQYDSIEYQNDFNSLSINNITYIDQIGRSTENLKIKIEKIENEIEKIKKENRALRNKTISNLVTRVENIGSGILDNPMIYHLVKNGLIDENYQLYISHYIEGGLTQNDTNFVLHINDGIHLVCDYNYKLSFIPELLKRIKTDSRSNNSLLNFDLYDYLLSSLDTKVHSYFFRRFNDWNKENQSFFIQFFERGINFNQFCLELNKLELNPSQLILTIEGSDELKTKMLISYLKILKPSELQNLNPYFDLQSFLSESIYFLQDQNIDLESKINLIDNLKLKLKDITSVQDLNFLNYLVDKCCYDITLDNIIHIEKHCSNNDEEHLENLFKRLYTEISEKGNKNLKQYIQNNFSVFVKDVYNHLDNLQDEKEELFLDMLEIAPDNKKNESIIVFKTSTIVTDIIAIESESAKNSLLQLNRISPTWENLIMYLLSTTGGQLEDIVLNKLVYTFITNYLEDGTLDFNIEAVKIDDVESEEILKFKQKLLLDVSFNDNVFIKMIENTSNDFLNAIEIEKWEVSKLKILILNKRLELTNENIDFILSNYNYLFIDFIISQFQKFLPIIESYDFEKEDLDKIIMSEDLTVKQKINFLSQFNFESRTKKVVVSKIVLEFIVREYNNLQLNKNEQLIILKSYSDSNQLIAKKFLILIFEKMKPSKENSKDLVIALKISNFSNLLNIEKGYTEKVNNNDENVKLLNYLEEINLISSFKPNKNGDSIIIQKKHKV